MSVLEREMPFDLDVSAASQLVVSRLTLARQAKRFREGFEGRVSYAVKANDNDQIISALHTSGIEEFDVASLHEIEKVKRLVPQSVLHYHNPVRSTEETLTALHRYDCRRFAVDHIDELEKIISLVSPGMDVEIAIRFRDARPSHAVQAFKSKFGATEFEAASLLKRADEVGLTAGLTFHPGSQTLSPTPYAEHIALAARIARTANVVPAFINVGGGFPSRYNGSAPSLLEDYFTAISQAVSKHLQGETIELECEPGRALVGPAGTLRTHVKAARLDRKELFLNDGIYGGLMEVYQFPQLEPAYVIDDADNRDQTLLEWTAFGPTCDPTDVLPFKLRLPADMQEGDAIQFCGVGAYSTATSTRFNGYGNINVILV